MTKNVNQFVGMYNALHETGYQNKLNDQTADILGDKTSISVADLKKTSIFSKVFKKLDETGQEKLNKLFNLDGDADSVNEKELKMILTLLDADLQTIDGEEKFIMDNEIGTEQSCGIYQATDREISYVYKNTKTRAEMQAEEIKKQEEAKKIETANNFCAQFQDYKEQIAADIDLQTDLNWVKNTLGENGYTTNPDGSITYKCGDYTVIAQHAGGMSAYVRNDIYDPNGNLIQTVTSSNLRGMFISDLDSQGVHVINYDDKGNPTVQFDYGSPNYGGSLEQVIEYKDGKPAREYYTQSNGNGDYYTYRDL